MQGHPVTMSTPSCHILALKYCYPRAESGKDQDMPGGDVSGKVRVGAYKNPLLHKAMRILAKIIKIKFFQNF